MFYYKFISQCFEVLVVKVDNVFAFLLFFFRSYIRKSMVGAESEWIEKPGCQFNDEKKMCFKNFLYKSVIQRPNGVMCRKVFYEQETDFEVSYNCY
jgi:hypothetical protein